MHEIDIRRIDLNLLKVFEALLEERSVTAAGARLGLAQSSISHALRRLRAVLGDPLFVRGTHGMQPTSGAIRLSAPISQALTSLQAALDDSTSFDPSSSRRVFTLLMTDIVELMFLPRLTSHLSTVAPGIQFVVQQLPRQSYRDALEQGTADLALGQMPGRSHDLLHEYLFDEHFTCVMRAGNPLRRSLTLATYMKAEHLVIGSPAISESLIKKALGARASHRRIRLRVPHYMIAPFVLAHTDLVAILPRTLSAAFTRLGVLAEVPVPFPIPPVITRQFWHSRSTHDPACQWLRGVIAREFAVDKSARTQRAYSVRSRAAPLTSSHRRPI